MKFLLLMMSLALCCCDKEPEPAAATRSTLQERLEAKRTAETANPPTKEQWQIYSATRSWVAYLRLVPELFGETARSARSAESRVRAERYMEDAANELPDAEARLEKAKGEILKRLDPSLVNDFEMEIVLEDEYRELDRAVLAARFPRTGSPAAQLNEEERARALLKAEDDVEASALNLVKLRKKLSPHLLGHGSDGEAVEAAFIAAGLEELRLKNQEEAEKIFGTNK